MFFAVDHKVSAARSANVCGGLSNFLGVERAALFSGGVAMRAWTESNRQLSASKTCVNESPPNDLSEEDHRALHSLAADVVEGRRSLEDAEAIARHLVRL